MKLCSTCQCEIPAERIAAIPLTNHCVRCILENGDKKIRRYDDYYGTEAEHCDSTFFFDGDRIMDSIVKRLGRLGCAGGDTDLDTLPVSGRLLHGAQLSQPIVYVNPAQTSTEE